MKKLEKYVDEMLDTGKKPRGFTNNQAQTLIDIYYSLCNNTRTFLKDRQVFCLLRNRFHLPGKERNEGLFVVWRNDVITVVKRGKEQIMKVKFGMFWRAYAPCEMEIPDSYKNKRDMEIQTYLVSHIDEVQIPCEHYVGGSDDFDFNYFKREE